jgi:membrane dipeptidase
MSAGIKPIVPTQSHIDQVASSSVAGIDHVGIGADFDGAPDMPPALNDASTYPLLMNTLTNRGWSSPDLEKLRSGNILRVLRAAEEVAAT